MKIILKYILKNIKEQKVRSLLIVIAILSSACLFYLSNSIADNFKEKYESQIRSSVGSSDIIIAPSVNSKSKFLSSDKLDDQKQNYEYIIDTMGAYGSYEGQSEKIKVNILGVDYENLQKLNPIDVIEGNVNDLLDNEIIISDEESKKVNLKVNDVVNIEINDKDYEYRIKAIAESKGFLANEIDTMTCIVPIENIEDIYSKDGMATTIFLKSNGSKEISTLLDDIREEYTLESVSESISDKEFRQATSQINMSFKIILIITVILSIFIIFTAFKVITLERIPVIGTFRSAGATEKTTMFVLILESLIYGILGGFLGTVSGVGVSSVIRMSSNPLNTQSFIENIQINIPLSIITFILAIVLSVISSFVPILKVSKISVKDIILNKLDSTTSSKSKGKNICAVVLLILALILININLGSYNILLQVLAIIFIYVGIILLIPAVFKCFNCGLELISRLIPSSICQLANKTLNGNSSMINNVKLLAISISSLLIINVVIASMLTGMLRAYDIQNYSAAIKANINDENTRNIISEVDGVKDTYGQYQIDNILVEDKKETIRKVEGVTDDKFLEYIELGNIDKCYSKLNENRNILLSNELKEILSVEEGEKIKLKFGEKSKEYTVIGFFKSNYIYSGSYALIGDKYYKEDTGNDKYTAVLFESKNDIDVGKGDIKQKFDEDVEVSYVLERRENETKEIKELSDMMRIFSVCTLLLGTFGILNNFLVSFIERKHSFATLTSVGMSKVQKAKLIIYESTVVGFVGSLMGGIMCIVILKVVEKLLISLRIAMPIVIEPMNIITYILLGVAISIIASIGFLLKFKKLSVVEELKYE